jgi:catechol 2,3-dioxygenase-like lactoylglutathione lyase family enzyme
MLERRFGHIDRREVLKSLGAALLGAGCLRAATNPLFPFSGIDHIALETPDSQKSLEFYTRIFGTAVVKGRNGRHYIRLGPNYLALASPVAGQRKNAGNYFGLGIENFEVKQVKQALTAAGIEATEVDGEGLLIHDPDGVAVELWSANSWSRLQQTASPISLPKSEARVQPTQINHLLLAVKDPEKSASFYEKVLGSPFTRSENPKRIWFRAGRDRVGLSLLAGSSGEPAADRDGVVNGQHLAGGQYLGIDHFGLVAPFDRAALTKDLQQAGAVVLPQVTNGPDADAIDFRDLNGVRVQISPPPKPRA